MTQRIPSNSNESAEWIEPEDFSSFGHDHASEPAAEEVFDRTVDNDEPELSQNDSFRSGPMIAVEQLDEALEERQNSDQRKKSVPIDFADRRKTIRRASDISS